jgi:Zn finger protein HypA/HybF involved in hydrogenase expression
MVEKVYQGVKSTGKNLWEAIMNSGNGCYNPPLVEEWIENEVEYYKSEDYDYENIDTHIQDLTHEERYLFYDILKEKGYELKEFYSFDLTRTIFQEWAREYDKSSEKPLKNFDKNISEHKLRIAKKEVCLKIYNLIIESLETYDSPRMQRAYNFAWDVFNTDAPSKGTDQEVEEFFGKKFPLIGVEIDREIYNLEEVFFCPNCNDPSLKEKQEALSEQNYFYCPECESYYEYSELAFRESNTHISEEEIISWGI